MGQVAARGIRWLDPEGLEQAFPGCDMPDIRFALASCLPMHLSPRCGARKVSLVQQKLGQIGTVLTGHPGYESRLLHVNASQIQLCPLANTARGLSSASGHQQSS